MPKSLKIMSVFGTRPEAIKLAPVILELQNRGVIGYETCISGQHKEMLDQMLKLFGIKSQYDLKIMTDAQTLEQISSKVLLGLEEIFAKQQPDVVLVQGDTTTALMGALAAFYKKIPVAHVEAGLRTTDPYNPFPEEMNRRLISKIAQLHFAPTKAAQDNLLAEGIKKESVFVAGNTVIDALLWVGKKNLTFHDKRLAKIDFKNQHAILVTTHRRENLGAGMEAIFSTIKRLSSEYSDLLFIFPVHLNPAIRNHAKEAFGQTSNVLLIDPLEYSDLASVLKNCFFVMTDSGGIQEEAPALGKPVLVLRNTTERNEGIAAGTAKLVGTNEDDIYSQAKQLIDSPAEYNKMATAVNPYGDGTASKKIADILLERF